MEQTVLSFPGCLSYEYHYTGEEATAKLFIQLLLETGIQFYLGQCKNRY